MSSTFYLQTPAANWHDALPSGNGQLGACVYGGVHRERICLNHETLWTGTHTPDLPDVSERLPELRGLLDAGKLEEANELYRKALTEHGYDARIGRYQPAADLCCEQSVHSGFRDYRRSLDMATGVVTVSWRDANHRLARRLFVSRAADFIVWELTAEAAFDLTLTLEPHDLNDCHGGPTAEISTTFEAHADETRLHLRGTFPGDIFYRVESRVQCDGQQSTVDGAIQITGAKQVLVVTRITVQDDTPVPFPDESLAFTDLLARHEPLHRGLFEDTQLRLAPVDSQSNEQLLLDAYSGHLPVSLAQRMADYGRYLLISSSRPHGLPSHLQGVWNGDYYPAWCCIYMLNENLQMNYWQALPGGLSDMLLAVFDYYETYLEDYRTNARNLFGCRGIAVPSVTTPGSGLAKNTSSHIICWTAAAGWLAQHYYDYFAYTQDLDFLRDRAVPFMREILDFYEDFLIEGPDGYWVSTPSTSPENQPNPGASAGQGKHISINATMDIAVARELCTNLKSASDLLGDAETATRCDAILQQLPPYQLNEDGAVREWMHPAFLDNYNHRHQSHLYPVFPGFEVTAESDPALYKAFRLAVEKRLVVGLQDQTGWSLSHMANIFARLGEAERAHECLALLAQNCTGVNLFTYHNDYRNMGITMQLQHGRRPAFQIDANMGFTAAVYEMLVRSEPGHIHLLPACPASWESGELRNLHCRGGIRLDLTWSAERIQVSLHAPAPRDVSLHFPDGSSKACTVSADPLTISNVRE